MQVFRQSSLGAESKKSEEFEVEELDKNYGIEENKAEFSTRTGEEDD